MARLCVRILPNDHPTDANLTPLRTQVGDVVCVVEDDHVFSRAELNCGHYKIVDMPCVRPEDISFLCDAALAKDDDRTMVRKRTRSLDLAKDLMVNPPAPEIVAKSMFVDAAKKEYDDLSVNDVSSATDAKMAELEAAKSDPELAKYVGDATAALTAVLIERTI